MPMGTILTRYDFAKDLTYVSVNGGMTVHDFLVWGNMFRSRRVTALVLWDLLGADLSALDTAEIKSLVSHTRGIAVMRKGGKIALVFGHPHDFGIGRMMEAYNEIAENPSEVRAFRTMGDAQNWLGV